MIDPLNIEQIITSDLQAVIGSLTVRTFFTADEDRTIRQAIFHGSGFQLLTFDPDLTLLAPQRMLLVCPQVVDASFNLFPSSYQLTDLRIPWLKGQNLYWAVDPAGNSQILQLIVS